MSKDPAFLFYPNDYIGGTMGMTFEEKGAYIELLMLQFNRGHMTGHMIGQTVGQLWDKIQDKFIKDEQGLYYNARLEIEIEKRRNFINTRYNNPTGKNQHSKKRKNKRGQVTCHTENENINGVFSSLLKKVLEKNSIILPDGFEGLILEWLKYKSEKNQSYKETGLTTLVKTFLKDTSGDLSTGRAMLDYSMSKNYSGLFKEKDNGTIRQSDHRPEKRVNDFWKNQQV